ncbi:MAG: phosphoribosylformylglycinamidine cyclo-ligase [Actinomycetota bacterium]
MPEKDKKYSYADSGVDIGRADRALEGLKNSITSTFSDRVLNDLSSYAGLFEVDLKGCKRPVLVSSTDGVGTKLLLAKEAGNYTSIGQDLVAMCINDILCCGAVPLFFLDYIACGKINERLIGQIIDSVSASCRTCNTALIGGETAEMPGMYGPDDIDLAGFAVGIVEKGEIISREKVKKEDILIGIGSSGLHSNGFSLIRKIIAEKNIPLKEQFGKKTLAAHLLTPTRLYYPLIHRLHTEGVSLHGIAHITGGGFYGNINRILPSGLDACINEGRWPIHPVFRFFMDRAGIDKEEMYNVFNMGIGMVLIAGEEEFKKIERAAGNTGDKAYRIGYINKGSGRVKIEFS